MDVTQTTYCWWKIKTRKICALFYFIFLPLNFVNEWLRWYLVSCVSSFPPSSSPSPSPWAPPLFPRSNPLLFPFSKGRASQGNEALRACQITRLGASPHISRRGKETQKLAKESETAPLHHPLPTPTVRNPVRTPSYNYSIHSAARFL